MKRHITYALIAVTALGAGTKLALAEDGHKWGHRHGDRMMHRLDLNDDGAIGLVEANAVGAVRFLRLDTDGDGIITEQEMQERIQKRIAERIAKRFAKMDRNGDGRVERSEFDEIGIERFARMDTDGDGRVSREELRAQRKGWGRGRHDDKPPVE